MRKILTFVAAVCCTMFLSVNSVMAQTAFLDGVKIEIAGVDAGAAADPLDILGDGGTVAYDVSHHSLILSAADIEAEKALSHKAGIFIDAGSLAVPLHIEVKSGNNITAKNVPGIWYKGGVGLQIVSLDNSNYLKVETQGEDIVFGVLCADDNLLGNPKPFAVQETDLTVSNYWSGDGTPGYAALYCEFYEFFHAPVLFETVEGMYPIIAEDDTQNQTTDVALMDASSSPRAITKGVAYNTNFPVIVDGVQMNDGLFQDVDGLYYLTSEDFSHIKEGSIAYDPAKKEIHLFGGFKVNATNTDEYALVIGEGYADEFTVIAEGVWYYKVEINGIGSTNNALLIRSKTTFDINGHEVAISSKNKDAIKLDGADLILKNGTTEEKELTIMSESGKGITGAGEVTFDHCKTVITAKEEVCMVGAINLVAVAITDPAAYVINGGQIDDVDKGLVAQDATVEFDLSVHTLSVEIYPKAEAGLVVVKDADDNALTLPYEFDKDQEVKLTPIPAYGWDFLYWNDDMTDVNPRTVSLDKCCHKEIRADFSRRIESDATYYAITSYGTIYVVDPKLRNIGEMAGELTLASGNELKRAVFVDGKIYFVEENLMENKIRLNVATFDGENVGEASALGEFQNTYDPIYAMAYSEADGIIYAVAYKAEEGKDVLLEVSLSDGSMNELTDMDPNLYTGNVRDIAVNAAGSLYALVDNGMVGLYGINISSGEATKIGDIDLFAPSYSESNLLFDPVTDELILAAGASTQIMLVDPATAKADWVSALMTSYPSIFTLGVAPTPKYTITVEVAAGQETMGTVDINGSGTTGKFEEGETVTLNAYPATADYEFVKWDDENTEESRDIVVGTEDKTYVASFKEKAKTYTIAVEITSGQETWGTVEIVDNTNPADLEEGTEIQIKAVPAEGYIFVEWAEDHDTNASRDFTVGTTNMTFTAVFAVTPKHKLTVAVEAGQDEFGAVEIESVEGKSVEIEEGAKATIKAIANEGYVFTEWKEDHDASPTRLVVMGKEDLTFTATFEAGTGVKITVAVAEGQDGWGTVSLPGDVTEAIYKSGVKVNLMATPTDGYTFVEWSDGSKDQIHEITVGDEDATYTATFAEKPKYEIKVAVADGQDGWGTVEIEGFGTSGKFLEGTILHLKAVAAADHKFDSWNDGIKEANRDYVVIPEDKLFVASFIEAPTPKTYPVIVAGIELTSEKSSLSSEDDAAIKAGFVSFDASTAVLTLNNLDLQTTGDLDALVIDNGEEKGSTLTIKIIGTNKIKSAAYGLLLRKFNTVRIVNDGEAKLEIEAAQGVVLSEANLEIESLAMTVKGSDYGIIGTEEEIVTVIGAKLEVQGTNGSILSIKNLKTEACDLDDKYEFNPETHQVEESGDVAKSNITFKAYPCLTITPVEEGTGHFELKGENAKYIDKGWFKKGEEITITAIAEDGFEFAYWTDDAKWYDSEDEDFMPAKGREFTMPASDKELSALFYAEVESKATWYGVNNDKFVAFDFSDRGAEVAKASSPKADNVKAGDFVDKSWFFLDNKTLKYVEFDDIEDGEAIEGDVETAATGAPSGVTDISADLINNKVYAVAGKKLYMYDKDDESFVAVGEFEYDEKSVSAVAIAVDAKGEIYILAPGTEGVLYTVSEINEDDEKVILDIVGSEEDGGKIGVEVTSDEQSMAFDHLTGELFWGAPDYLRVIDIDNLTAHIAGDLGQADKIQGKQGVIKSLHRKDRSVKISVSVADGQDERGSVKINGYKKQSGYAIVGSNVTINATPAEGFQFSKWVYNDETIKTAQYTFKVGKKNMSFVAYFDKAEQGIEDVELDETVKVQKLLIDGVMYIFREGKIYDTTGRLVE